MVSDNLHIVNFICIECTVYVLPSNWTEKIFDNLILYSNLLFRSSTPDDDDDRDILIHGMPARNRAIHGDLVVVEVLPRSEWRGRSSVIKENQEGQSLSEDLPAPCYSLFFNLHVFE